MSREGQERVCFYLDKDIKRKFHALCAQSGTRMTTELRAYVTRLVEAMDVWADPSVRSVTWKETKEGSVLDHVEYFENKGDAARQQGGEEE